MKKILTFILLPFTLAFAVLFSVGVSTAPRQAKADSINYDVVITWYSKGEVIFELNTYSTSSTAFSEYLYLFQREPEKYPIDWVNLKGWSFSEGGERIDLSKHYDNVTTQIYALYTETPWAEGEEPKDPAAPTDSGTEEKTESKVLQSIKDFCNKVGLGNVSTAWQVGIVLVAGIILIRFVFGRR